MNKTQKRAIDLQIQLKLPVRRAQVLALVIENEGRTHGELARLMYETWPSLGIIICAESPHKRLVELQDVGYVRTAGARKCTETGTLARSWWANKRISRPHQSSTSFD